MSPISITRCARLALAFSALAWISAGCGGGGELRDASLPGGSYARIAISYVHRHGAPANQLQLGAAAQFVRYRHADAAAVEALLGQLPTSRPPGQCRVVDRWVRSGAAFSAGGPDVDVTLLDAGELELRGPGIGAGRLTLQARRHPDLVPFVSGVFYDEREAVADGEAAPAGEVQVVGTGGDIGPFAVSVPLPLDAPGLELAWSAAGLEVRWAAAGEAEGLSLEVRETRGDGGRVVACQAADDGSFTVPAALVQALGSRDLEVAAARLHRRAFAAAGIAGGEVIVARRETRELLLPDPEATAP